MRLSDTTVKVVAGVPLKVTDVEPVTPVPKMLTLYPGCPKLGLVLRSGPKRFELIERSRLPA